MKGDGRAVIQWAQLWRLALCAIHGGQGGLPQKDAGRPDAITGKRTPRQALDRLAESQDRAMAVMQRHFTVNTCGPKLDNEKPAGQTIPYDELLQAWREGRVR